MGYCVDMHPDITIPKAKVQKALDAINEIMQPKYRKARAGGSVSQGGRIIENHYSWVSNPIGNKFLSIEDAFKAWRYPARLNDSGDLKCTQFSGEKLGDDKFFFETIAPFVNCDCEVMCEGEDGSKWRYKFTGKAVKEQQGKVTYAD